MSRRRFIHGETYRLEEFIGTVWGNLSRAHALPPDTLFVYHDDGQGYFEQLVEPDNPVVGGEVAQQHVEALRKDGRSWRWIATAAGVGVESVHRAAAGGRIRATTEAALLAVPPVSRNGRGR